MSQSFLATFEDGVLKPHEQLDLAPHSQVRVSVEAVKGSEDQLVREAAWKEIQRLWRESTFNSGGDRLTRDELHERR